MRYRLDVNGLQGSLSAILSFNGEDIADTIVRDIKEAEKWAQATAEAHKADNMSAPFRSFTKSFSL